MASVDRSHTSLRKRFDDLNIEGVCAQWRIAITHRGVRAMRAAPVSALTEPCSTLAGGLQPKTPGAKSVQLMELGEVDGVPLSLTDGTALQGGACL